MKLVANLIVHNELDRYLPACLEVLLDFCDLVVVADDGSTDGTYEYMRDLGVAFPKIEYLHRQRSKFFDHESRARQQALDYALSFDPTHILAIDADEIIEDGYELRKQIERTRAVPSWTLCMEEVWSCDEQTINVRCDGRWGPHRSLILYRVEGQPASAFQLRDQALGGGRVPPGLRAGRDSGVSILHFGWANVSDRQARYDRYELHDGGRFHAKDHLDSIMNESIVKTRSASWDKVPAHVRRTVAARANRGLQTLPAA